MRLDGTLVELAAEMGLTHEALYRTLGALEKDGIVRRTKSAIVLRRRPHYDHDHTDRLPIGLESSASHPRSNR